MRRDKSFITRNDNQAAKFLNIHVATYKKYKNICIENGWLVPEGGNYKAISFAKIINDLGLLDVLNKAYFIRRCKKYSLNEVYWQIKHSILEKNIRQQEYMIKRKHGKSDKRPVSGKYHVAKLIGMSSSSGRRILKQLKRGGAFRREVRVIKTNIPAFDSNYSDLKNFYKGSSFIRCNSAGLMDVYFGSRIHKLV